MSLSERLHSKLKMKQGARSAGMHPNIQRVVGCMSPEDFEDLQQQKELMSNRHRGPKAMRSFMSTMGNQELEQFSSQLNRYESNGVSTAVVRQAVQNRKKTLAKTPTPLPTIHEPVLVNESTKKKKFAAIPIVVPPISEWSSLSKDVPELEVIRPFQGFETFRAARMTKRMQLAILHGTQPNPHLQRFIRYTQQPPCACSQWLSNQESQVTDLDVLETALKELDIQVVKSGLSWILKHNDAIFGFCKFIVSTTTV